MGVQAGPSALQHGGAKRRTYIASRKGGRRVMVPVMRMICHACHER